MKKVLAFAVAAVVGLSAMSVFAGGDGCCMAGKAKGAACSDMFSKLNLTPEQKAKIDALKDDAKRAVSTSEAHAMFSDGLAKILTPEQLTEFKAQCDKAKAKAGGGCPFMNSQKKS
jgi:Spy/CpxP family protein refolding chaperone